MTTFNKVYVFSFLCFVIISFCSLFSIICIKITELPYEDKMQIEQTSIEQLLDAMRIQESGGDDMVVGDNGLSKGPLQITEPYWFDACEYGKVLDDTNWKYDISVWDWGKSKQAVKWYWQRYCSEAYKENNFEVLARIHNGGPNGHLKDSTLKYWEKLKGKL